MATRTQVQVLYIGYFGRPADPDGLAFWANGVVGTNEELDQLADSFAESLEYQVAISGLTTAQIIDLFYKNMFGRTAEPTGSQFWQEGIASGVLNPQDIGVDIGLSALEQTLPNADTQVITAKVLAANEFTQQLAANSADDAAYTGAAGIEAGRQFLNAVLNAETIPSPAEIAGFFNGISGG